MPIKKSTETAEVTEVVRREKAPRCGHETSSGPCVRPANHSPNGHMSAQVLDNKKSKAKGKSDISDDPEVKAAMEALAAAKAKAAEKAAAEKKAQRRALFLELAEEFSGEFELRAKA